VPKKLGGLMALRDGVRRRKRHGAILLLLLYNVNGGSENASDVTWPRENAMATKAEGKNFIVNRQSSSSRL
jgi:hypothetical protein